MLTLSTIVVQLLMDAVASSINRNISVTTKIKVLTILHYFAT